MCGRVDFSWEADDPAVNRLQQIMTGSFPNQPLARGEVPPGTTLPVLVDGVALATVQLMHWGVPLQNKRLLINARSESAAGKPMFRSALQTRRCVLPTTGFYEWRRDETRQKYLFRLQGGCVVYLAGLFDEENRFVILTRQANADMAPIHERMPVILRSGEVRAFLRSADFARQLFTREAPALLVQPIGA